jgi:predicted transcriptional regulator
MVTAPRKPLGELESAILGVVWDSAARVSVREVLDRLERGSALAYTTVLTVLDRLHDKGLVAREKEGKAFCYWPVMSREVFLGQQAARVLTESRVPVNRDVLMAFLDSAEHADPAVLDELSALIRSRRKRGRA